MKRALLALILALPLAVSAQFRIVGTGLFTTLNDSTYRAKIDFRPDLTGNSYNATQLTDSMLVLSQKGQLYRLDSFYNASFSSAFIIVVEKNGNWGSPVGQVMVFQNNSSLAAPQAVYGANGATAGMQAGVDTWNALLLKVVSDSAVYWNQAYSNSIDSLNVSGDSLKTITLYRAGGDSISATFVDGGGSGGGGPVTDTLTGEVKGPLDSTYIDTVANIIFTTTTDTTVGVGELEYNDTQGSLIQGLKGGNVTNIIGQQIHQRVTNATGGPLTKGTAVFLHGSQGNRITVRKALATADSTSANTFGIVAESIADNQSGYVITEGLITNINTNALTEGAAVYLSPTVAGELTTTKPQAPQHTVYIGVCVKQHTGSGELFVKIRNGQELDELHDVRIDSPVSNASLYYNSSESVWRDTTTAALKSDISGTANYLAKFTGSNAVGNSVIQDNGTNVGISASPSSFKLDINGSTHTTGDFYADRATRSASAGFVSAQTNNRWLAGMISNSGSWHVYDLLRSTSVMTLDSATGNVGIGTASPGYKLSVAKYTSGTTQGEIVQSIIGNTVYSTVGQWAGLSLGTYADKVGVFAYDGYNNFGRNDLVFAVASGGNTNPVTLTDEKMRILNNGNVGIATSSPSRPLHVNANTSMIIPSGETGTRPASGANGDLRYSTTVNNIEFYDGSRGLWERPLVGTVAANKVAFASGDTLTSNANFHWDNTNTRLGIGNATPDSTLTVTGGIRATTGVTAARFTATGSTVPTNGMYLPATNALAFSTNSTERMRILSDGKVGINATPTEQLQVGGTVRATRVNVNTFSTQVVSMNNYAPTGANGGNLFIGNGGASLTLGGGASSNASSNLGIGFGALQSNTTASLNLAIGGDALIYTTTGSQNIGIGQGAGAFLTTGEGNTYIGRAAGIYDSTSSFNIGIGAYALSSVGIGGESKENIAIGNSAGENLRAGSYNNVMIGASAAKATAASAVVTSLNSSVYIGNYTTPSATTGVSNEIAIGYQTAGNGSNTTTIGNSSTTKTFFQYGETYIGTATDNGAFALQVGGTGYFSTGLRVDYTATFDANTIFQMPNTSTKAAKGYAWNTYSDARIKSNFDTIQNALQAVQALKPVYYDQYDSEVIDGKIKLQDGKTRTVGFIAQDVAPVIPAAVQAGNDTQLWGMDYTKLIPYLTKAIQEQQAQIEALKKEIEALKNK